MNSNATAALHTVRAILLIGASVYMVGLAYIMELALANGRAVLTPDGTLPYELAFVIVLVAFLLVVGAREIVKVFEMLP